MVVLRKIFLLMFISFSYNCQSMHRNYIVNPDDVESVLQEAGAQEAYTAKLLNGDYIKSERISDQIACTQISEKKGKRVIPTSNFKIIKNIYDAKFKARQAQQ